MVFYLSPLIAWCALCIPSSWRDPPTHGDPPRLPGLASLERLHMSFALVGIVIRGLNNNEQNAGILSEASPGGLPIAEELQIAAQSRKILMEYLQLYYSAASSD
jgi:hypothetical protein